MTAMLDGTYVVFMLGMRINRLWKLTSWLPVTGAMPRMLKELEAHPELGYLGGETWFGRTTLLMQYWRSLDQLMAYATNREAEHSASLEGLQSVSCQKRRCRCVARDLCRRTGYVRERLCEHASFRSRARRLADAGRRHSGICTRQSQGKRRIQVTPNSNGN